MYMFKSRICEFWLQIIISFINVVILVSITYPVVSIIKLQSPPIFLRCVLLSISPLPLNLNLNLQFPKTCTTMKTSPSFPSKRTIFLALMVMIFLMFFSSVTTTTTTSTRISRSGFGEVSSSSIQNHQLYNYRKVQAGKNGVQKSWNTISRGSMQSPPAAMNMINCYQFQRIRDCAPFSTPPPPPPSDYEIDPRYGVEKRLVPSGPNPLHN
ncbi:CLAVATA3/ESR (CLE)-related protein 9-like [Coffea eugenioides]|uniref:CLAVATA3/ESR (CLE)-related protein 9-like n=1 Tax=Coffea eugenioides TaxID=49369 RepID=UPI000F61492C|nr:CLAVATA3/ESR (CLE)-related protein 9-like [Coffea eugenioides]